MTLRERNRKGAKAKKPRVSSTGYPLGWSKAKIVQAYKDPDVISKEDWIKNWNATHELQLNRDKVNRWARELKNMSR